MKYQDTLSFYAFSIIRDKGYVKKRQLLKNEIGDREKEWERGGMKGE